MAIFVACFPRTDPIERLGTYATPVKMSAAGETGRSAQRAPGGASLKVKPAHAHLRHLRLPLPVHGRRRRALVSQPRRAPRGRRARGHLPDAAPVGPRRGAGAGWVRAGHSGRPADGALHRERPAADPAAARVRARRAPGICCATAAATTSCIPAPSRTSRCSRRPCCARCAATGSSSTGSRSGAAPTGTTTSAASRGGSARSSSAPARRSRSARSASPRCTQRACAPRVCAARSPCCAGSTPGRCSPRRRARRIRSCCSRAG